MTYRTQLAAAGAALLAVGSFVWAQDAQPEPDGKGPDSPPAVTAPQKGGPTGKSKSKSARPPDPAARPADDSTDSGRTPGSPAGDSAEPAQPNGRLTAGTQRREPLAPDAREIQFAFVTAPWDQVLDWFSKLSGLSLLMDVKPSGTFNYINDPRKYTIGEAMDVLNDQLALKGFYLVRKDNYLRVIALAEGIPPDLIPQITREQLARRGKSEFVSVLVPVKGALASEAAKEIQGLKGQYGKVLALESVNRLMITDTAANVRLMLELLNSSDDTAEVVQSKFRVFTLKFTVASKVEPNVREILGLPQRTATTSTTDSRRQGNRDPGEEWRNRMQMFMQGGGGPGGMQFGGGFPGFGGDQRGGDERRGDRGGDRDRGGRDPQQPTVFTAVDDRLNQLLVRAPADMLAVVEEVIKQIDMPRDEDQKPFTPREPQTPVVKIIRIDGDAQSLAAALQTIYQNTPGVKFSATSDNAIIVVATPDDQKAITALIKEFEEENLELAVLPLSVLDATSVSDLLGAVYSSSQVDFRGRPVARPGQPRIQADLTQNRLVVRGSKKQIDDIKQMLASLGESSVSSVAGTDRMFLIPNSQNQRETLERIKQIWDTAHPNNSVRIIDVGKRPDQSGRGGAPDRTEPSGGAPRNPEAIRDKDAPPSDPNAPRSPRNVRPMSSPTRPDRTSRDHRTAVQFASLSDQDEPQQSGDRDEPARQQPGQKGSPIVIAPGPDVMVITSEDAEALQKFMNLYNTLTRGTGGGQEYNVFYLKAADATQVATQLLDLLAPASTSTGGGFSPFGGGFFGGGTPQRTSTLKIVADTRTNSLLVTGTSADVMRVTQLLDVLDREDAPASGALNAPRIIPVRYTSAASVYQVIRDVYSAQLVSGSRGPTGFPGFTAGGFGGFGGGFPGGPQQQGGGSRSGRNSTLALGVDERSNSIVVSCSEAMYKEIGKLVETLDLAANDTKRTVKIVTIRNSTPTAVQDALNGLMGVNQRSRSSTSGGFGGGPGFGGGGPFGGQAIGIPFGGGFPGGGQPFGGGQGGGFRGGGFPGGGGFQGGGFPGGGFQGGGFRGGNGR